MYGVPYIFHFVHLIVKLVEMMVKRVDFERTKSLNPSREGSLAKKTPWCQG